jgi:hypothetical protein
VVTGGGRSDDSCHCLRVQRDLCGRSQILSVITKAAPCLTSFSSGIEGSNAYLSGDLRVNVTELLTPPDVEITSVNEAKRTFMRPDGTTYTKE